MMRFIFDKTNKLILIISLVFLAIGYGLMATGDETFSTIILVVVYVVGIPLSLIFGLKKTE